MSLGADAHRAADVAQSTFAEAFAVWDRIEHPTAWLRREAGRLYYRHLVPQETPVEGRGKASASGACGCGMLASARGLFVGYTSNAHRTLS
jgi:hypothetical protein